jgi:hypothetical protein
MSPWQTITRSNFVIKLKAWEYWPFGIVQFPLMIYWLWLSLKARSLFFFSASNPGIDMGGMFGESKFEVLQKIPGQYVPKTVLAQIPITKEGVVRLIEENQFHYPVIFKPDIGERGLRVRKIQNSNDIDDYLRVTRGAFLIQDLVDLPCEFGIFYTRIPSEEKGEVTSVVMKEMLTVTGDGSSTLRTLILSNDRAKLQWPKLQLTFKSRLEEVLPAGQKVELVSIGNHALGTKFLDGSKLINEKLSAVFDRISRQIDGFYFGRYDLRCASVEDLYDGKFIVMELNGCGAEPAHIYEPGYSLGKAMRVLFTHWKNIYRISTQNRQRGVKYISLKDAYHFYRKFKNATRL